VFFWGGRGIKLPKPPSLYQLVRWQIACGILYLPVAIYIKNENCKTNENARVSVSAGRLLAVLFIHLWQFTTNENAGNGEKTEMRVRVSVRLVFTCRNLQQTKKAEIVKKIEMQV